MPRTASQVRPDIIRSAPRHSTTVSTRDRVLVLDCLRVRDLGGDWLDHESFDLVADRTAVTAALVADGLATWDDFGIHITPAGRRAWAEQRRALHDIEVALLAPTPLPSLTCAFSRRAAIFGTHEAA